ncbi:MAG: SpoVA/SpoVAEb family sporulation membrane protein [Firmicutes bacterium]|jgi:stage V sporulation protein AC|nr:SpoVA/SpoVAEb family sporulation membrane protein [Bacillota bacterium]
MSSPGKRKQKRNEQAKYQRLANSLIPKPPLARNMGRAFVVGGLICAVGQGVLNAFVNSGMSLDDAVAPTLAVMILIGAVLTGASIYHHIGEFAGAGAAVPITGFSNTIVAAAMDFKREGFVMGMGAKMFIIAGPVLVFGTVTGVFVALLRWLYMG